ncbi:carboxypeptidase B-like [Asterias rubens]|uniref:carboxypeptidase B-like n=1 Tax=Asterias rubens TaxID=7604 RepID=UPI001455715F|nr:carboxypeptidase B-like [Asterias rubens]
MKLLLVLSLCVLGAFAQSKTYAGYQVFQITPHNDIQHKQMSNLNFIFNEELDFWSSSPVNQPSEVMVPPHHVAQMKNELADMELDYTIKWSNVQTLIEKENAKIQSRVPQNTLASFDYNVYHSYQEIMNWITNFVNSAPPTKLTLTEIEVGRSYENRQIKAIKLSTGSGRYGAYTQGGIHAREWVSPATVINLLKKFVDGYANGDTTAVKFFEKFDWYVIPLLNVDGYFFTRPESNPSDRLWRKNRQPTTIAQCVGIDMNRNYGYKWASGGSSSNPCSQVYHGEAPYSAGELKTVTDWLLSMKQTFHIHVDVHAFSQYWVYPYGYCYTSERKTADHYDLQYVAKKSTEALTAVHGTYYIYSTAGDWYPAAGSSEDFGYEILKAKYTYTIEMRDTGAYGFELPENQIKPCGEETYAGFHKFFSLVTDEY